MHVALYRRRDAHPVPLVVSWVVPYTTWRAHDTRSSFRTIFRTLRTLGYKSPIPCRSCPRCTPLCATLICPTHSAKMFSMPSTAVQFQRRNSLNTLVSTVLLLQPHSHHNSTRVLYMNHPSITFCFKASLTTSIKSKLSTLRAQQYTRSNYTTCPPLRLALFILIRSRLFSLNNRFIRLSCMHSNTRSYPPSSNSFLASLSNSSLVA